MKRLNPITNLPFKRGDVREDGRIFYVYKIRIKKDGFFEESWVWPASIENARNLTKKWRKENPEKFKNCNKSWDKRHPEKIKETGRKSMAKWRKNNPEKRTAQEAAKRAQKLNASPPWLTKEHKKEIVAIYKMCLEMTKKTGEQHHVDHIVPLRGKTVSGLHVPWNLQILPAKANLTKSNKWCTAS